MELSLYRTRISDIQSVVGQLETLSSEYRIFAFEGDLGAGKTTLIKSWMKRIGVHDNVTSPTYAIINEYMCEEDIIYHMDCYRLKTLEEAIVIGIEEYLESGQLCLIEWPAIIMELIRFPYIRIAINQESQEVRDYHITCHRRPRMVITQE